MTPKPKERDSERRKLKSDISRLEGGLVSLLKDAALNGFGQSQIEQVRISLEADVSDNGRHSVIDIK